MLDWYKGEHRYWWSENPPEFKKSLHDAATTFGKECPCLQQVWQFVYMFYQLQWRVYDIIRIKNGGETMIDVNVLANARYETEVSKGISSSLICSLSSFLPQWQ